MSETPLVDPFARCITYLRVSVTDRCDFRCVYCMSEDMTFLPKAEVLTLEELERASTAFVRLGVSKLRLTGGEPLVRRNIMSLFHRLGRLVHGGALKELTLTTNGSQLERYAAELYDCGVRRVNVSLDTLDAAKFAAITRWGQLDKVLAGVAAAKAAGLKVKINAVALRDVNDGEARGLVAWAHGEGHDVTFIEVMPMGEIGSAVRLDQFFPLSMLRARLASSYTLDESDYRTGGPARYFTVRETGGRIGFITPMTHNFCEVLQPRAPHLHRHALHVPRPAGRCRFAHALARERGRRPPRLGHPLGDRPQAQGPRLRHRPPPAAPGGAAPHERHRRLSGTAAPSLDHDLVGELPAVAPGDLAEAKQLAEIEEVEERVDRIVAEVGREARDGGQDGEERPRPVERVEAAVGQRHDDQPVRPIALDEHGEGHGIVLVQHLLGHAGDEGDAALARRIDEGRRGRAVDLVRLGRRIVVVGAAVVAGLRRGPGCGRLLLDGCRRGTP